MRALSRVHPAYLWRRFLLSDPDLGQLRKGLRASVSAALAALVLSRLARVLGEPPTLTLVGALVAMQGTQFATDPTLREQRVTTRLMVLPALASLLLGTLAAPIALLGKVAFAATIFLTTYVRRFGPRGTALGMVGFFTFFDALFFHVQLSQLPALAGAVVLALAIAYLTRFVLIPDRPSRDLQRTLRAFRGMIDLVLWELVALSRRHRPSDASARRLGRLTHQLNDTALRMEELLGHEHNDLRLRLFDLELAAHRVIEAIQQVVASGALEPRVRVAMRGALLAARALLQRETPAARTAFQTHLALVRAASEDARQSEAGRADARRFRTSLTDLVAVAARLPADPLLRPRPLGSLPPPMPASPAPTSPQHGLRPSTRQALQVTVASVLAMVAGHGLSADRWYWAVITSFVIFTRTKTRGETLVRAGGRVLGTVLGVVAGLVLARFISGHRMLELVSLFVCMFFGFYLIQRSYGWMVFWFTTLISILYGLLGRFTPGLLYLRLEETAIGAAIGMLTALLLLPERTRAHVQAAARQVLAAACPYLEEAVVQRTRDTDPTRLVDLARALDVSLRELRTAAQPLEGRIHFSPRTARLVHSVSELVLFIRHLAMGEGLLRVREPVQELIREAGARLVRNARALAQAIGRGEPPTLEPASELLERARQALQGEETIHQGPTSPPVLLHWLARVDDILHVLARSEGPESRKSSTRDLDGHWKKMTPAHS